MMNGPSSTPVTVGAWPWEFPAALRNRTVAASLVVVVLTLIARLPLLADPGWSVDSYNNWTHTPGAEFFLAQGRPGQFVLVMLTQLLGIGRDGSAVVLQTFGVACFAAAAPLLFTTFSPKRNVPLAIIVGSSLLFTLHPFQVEILTFPEASFYANASIAAGIVSIWLGASGGKRMLAGILLLSASLTVYQLALNYVALMIMFGVVLAGADAIRQYQMPQTPSRRLLNAVACAAAATVLYFMIAKGSSFVAGVALTERASVLSMDKWGARALEFAQLSLEMAQFPLIVSAKLAKALLIVGTVGGLVALLWSVRRDWRAFSISVAALLLMTIAAAGVILVGSVWWPVPRVLGGYSLVAAMLVYLLWVCSGSKKFSAIIGAMVSILLLAFASIGTSIHADQKLVNEWDRQLAATIYARAINLVPDPSKLEIEIANRHMLWAHPRGVQSLKGDMNISAFFISSSIPGLFAATTGRTIVFVEPPAATQAACEIGPYWPSPESMKVNGNRVTACL